MTSPTDMLPRGRPTRTWAACVAGAIFILCVIVYNLNFREVSEDDTIAVRYIPLSLLIERDLDLDEFGFLYCGQTPLPYYLSHRGGHYYARSPFMPGLMATPVYWVARLAGWLPLSEFDLPYTARMASKVAASLMAAASAAVMLVALLRVASPRRAVVLALVYAFGTNVWAVSSQGLWQHAPAQLWIALMWLCLIPTQDQRRLSLTTLVLAGAAMGLAVSCRPASLPIGLVALAYCVHRARLRAGAFVVGFAVAAAPTAAFNLAVFGSIQGGYAELLGYHPAMGRVAPWGGAFWPGLAGLLFSPSRGLLIYTPVCVFSFIGWWHWRQRGGVLGWYLLASVLIPLVMGAKFFSWWAGWSFGPRYLMEALPALVLLMAPIGGLLKPPRWGIAFAALSLWSVGVQAVGAFCYPAGWNWSPLNVDTHPERLWDWRDTQLRRCLASGVRPTFWEEWSTAYSDRALRLYAAGQHADAARFARRALELDPANYKAHNTLGNVAAMTAGLRQAEPHYRDALRSNPRSATAHNNLAACLIARNEFVEAEAHVRRAIALDPELAPAYRNLGDICAATGRRKEAFDAYSQALRLNPSDAHSERARRALGRDDKVTR